MTNVALSLQSLEDVGVLTPNGLKLADPELPYEQYEAVGALLGRAHRSLQWAIGDWLALGEALYGEAAYQASEELGISPDGRAQYLRVALAFPHGRRRAELSWSHHRTLISLEPAEQNEWLDRAAANGWANYELGEHLRNELGPVNRGRGASKPNPEFEQRAYVVEAVEEAAREVCLRAEPMVELNPAPDSPGLYSVPADALRSLAHALGLPVLADAPGTISAREEAA